MKNDLTILYYTANRVDDRFAERIRAKLLDTIGDLPLISVSQKPLPGFGLNIVMPDLQFSIWSVYRQILEGCRATTTRYIVTAEDDHLFPLEHFAYRPPKDDTFYYNVNRWWLENFGVFRLRIRTNMGGCITNRELMLATLEARYAKFPTPLVMPEDRNVLKFFSEPGRYEGNLGLPARPYERFQTKLPLVSFNHKGLGGRRKPADSDETRAYLEPWGRAVDVWNQYVGQKELT